MLFSSTLQVRDSGRRLCVIIVAEGAQDVAGNPVKSDHIREVRFLEISVVYSSMAVNPCTAKGSSFDK